MDRVGISIKDRLGKRCTSSASTDSGINVTSPPPMDEHTPSDPFSQPLIQTLCGVELQDHEVNLMSNKEAEIDEDAVLKEDFPDCPDLYADCVDAPEDECADVLENGDKEMSMEKGEEIIESEPSKIPSSDCDSSKTSIPDIVIDKAPEVELVLGKTIDNEQVKVDNTPEPVCQEEGECGAKDEAKDAAQPAQGRLRKRKEIKESIQKAAAHAAMVEKIKIKRE